MHNIQNMIFPVSNQYFLGEIVPMSPGKPNLMNVILS